MKDLHYRLLCVLVAKTRVLADYLVWFVLCDDPVAVVGWGVEVGFKDCLDDVGEGLECFGGAAL